MQRRRNALQYVVALLLSVSAGALLAAFRVSTSLAPDRVSVAPAVRVSSHIRNPHAAEESETPSRAPTTVPDRPTESVTAVPVRSTVAPTVAPRLEDTRHEESQPVSTEATWPVVEAASLRVLPDVWQSHGLDEGKSTSLVRCASVGMQQKCLFRNLAVQRNKFISCGPNAASAGYPNPLFLPDGQPQPLIQYHKYRGHKVAVKRDACTCSRVVTRPTVFLFRMSGHSTYHLWENNLGPFYSTLQEFAEVKAAVNDPSQLLVAFGDDKPVTGPKAPHLLDQLLRTFSDRSLINASTIAADDGQPVCFEKAIVGISANSFPHMALLHQMMRNIVGFAPPPPLPEQPRCLFISRNHESVVRGRKIANEAAVVAKLNATLMEATGRPLEYIQMETLKYRQQVELAMHTNIMFSPHGGGVANCIWMAKGSVMVEFVAPVGKTLLNMYHSMCGKSGVKHISFLSEPDPADASVTLDNPRLFSNMVVPPDRIAEHAQKALEHFHKARAKAKSK